MLCDGVLTAITWQSLTACTTVKPNSEQPIFGKHIYYYYHQWADYCKQKPTRLVIAGSLKWRLIKTAVCTCKSKNLDTTRGRQTTA